MKAITYKEYGGPEVLQLNELNKPEPKENEVLIKIFATSVTAGDTRMRSFTVPAWQWIFARIYLGLRKPKRPILGMELSGKIEAIGSKVTRFKVGDEVFASTLNHDFGAYAEYKCLPENGNISLKPANLDYLESATLPIGAGTALRLLRKGNVQSGKKILIYGASGSVGTYAIQLAKYYGAHVTAVSSTSSLPFVKSLEVDKIIDYTKENINTWGKYDLIFDAVGKVKKSKLKSALLPGGAFVSVSGNSGKENQEDFLMIKQLVESNMLRPIITKTYDFKEISKAHSFVDTGHKRGNVGVKVIV